MLVLSGKLTVFSILGVSTQKLLHLSANSPRQQKTRERFLSPCKLKKPG